MQAVPAEASVPRGDPGDEGNKGFCWRQNLGSKYIFGLSFSCVCSFLFALIAVSSSVDLCSEHTRSRSSPGSVLALVPTSLPSLRWGSGAFTPGASPSERNYGQDLILGTSLRILQPRELDLRCRPVSCAALGRSLSFSEFVFLSINWE